MSARYANIFRAFFSGFIYFHIRLKKKKDRKGIGTKGLAEDNELQAISILAILFFDSSPSKPHVTQHRVKLLNGSFLYFPHFPGRDSTNHIRSSSSPLYL